MLISRDSRATIDAALTCRRLDPPTTGPDRSISMPIRRRLCWTDWRDHNEQVVLYR